MMQVQTLASFPPPSTTPVNPVASANAAVPALGRLPTEFVARPLQQPEIRPDPRYAFTRTANIAPQTLSIADADAQAQIASPATAGGISSFPTLFLAQLMGQNTDSATQMLVVSYETMLEFSQVKYKPSGASKPETPSGMSALFQSLLDEGNGTVAANRNVAPPVATTANSNAPQNVQQAATAATKTTAEAPAAALLTLAASTDKPVSVKRYTPSAAASQAYAQAATRNKVELGDVPKAATAEAEIES